MKKDVRVAVCHPHIFSHLVVTVFNIDFKVIGFDHSPAICIAWSNIAALCNGIDDTHHPP